MSPRMTKLSASVLFAALAAAPRLRSDEPPQIGRPYIPPKPSSRADAFPLKGNPNWILELESADDYEFADPQIARAALATIGNDHPNRELRIRAEEARYHYNRNGNNDVAARANVAKLIELDPTSARYSGLAAEMDARAKGREGIGSAEMLAILERDPTDSTSQAFLLKSLIQEGDFAGAKRYLERFSKAGAQSPLLACAGALLRTIEGKYAEADAEFGKAFEAAGRASIQYSLYSARASFYLARGDLKSHLTEAVCLRATCPKGIDNDRIARAVFEMIKSNYASQLKFEIVYAMALSVYRFYPGDPVGQCMLADASASTGRFDRAEELIRELRAPRKVALPSKYGPHIGKLECELALKRGDDREAVRLAENALTGDPGDSEYTALYVYSLIYPADPQNRDLAKAYRRVDSEIARSPKDAPNLLYLRAQIGACEGKFAEALKTLDDAERAPQDGPIDRSQLDRLRNLYRVGKNYEYPRPKPVAADGLILGFRPELLGEITEKIDLHFAPWETVLKMAKIVLANPGSDPKLREKAIRATALMASNSGRPDWAGESFERELAALPDTDGLSYRWQKGNLNGESPSERIAAWQKYIAQHPRSADAYAELAVALAEATRPDEAGAAVEAGEKIDGECTAVLLARGVVAGWQNRDADALAAANRARRRPLSVTDSMTACSIRSCAYLGLERYDDAIGEAAVMKMYASNISGGMHWAYDTAHDAFLKREKYALAYQCAIRMKELKPGDEADTRLADDAKLMKAKYASGR